jgi:hypothetical protein
MHAPWLCDPCPIGDARHVALNRWFVTRPKTGIIRVSNDGDVIIPGSSFSVDEESMQEFHGQQFMDLGGVVPVAGEMPSHHGL